MKPRYFQSRLFAWSLLLPVLVMNLLLLAGAASGQSNEAGTWSILNVRVGISPKWSAWGELQLRSLAFYDQFHYHETKGGLQYKAGKDVSLLAGVGRYVTYSPGGNFKSPVLNDEIRTWIQASLTNQMGRFKWEHRYRLEQRWTSQGYRNRFRYRLNAVVPLNKANLEPGTLYATVWDEIFLTNLAPHFERNRFFAGLGYEISPPFTLQAGWLNQYDYRLAIAPLSKNFLQLSLLFDLHVNRNLPAKHPSTLD